MDKKTLQALKSKIKTHKDEVICWMGESMTVPKSRTLTTIGVIGCTICVINAKEENFISHIAPDNMAKLGKDWAKIYKKMKSHKATVYLCLLDLFDTGVKPGTSDDYKDMKKAFPDAEIIEYEIGTPGKVHIRNNTITTNLNIVK